MEDESPLLTIWPVHQQKKKRFEYGGAFARRLSTNRHGLIGFLYLLGCDDPSRSTPHLQQHTLDHHPCIRMFTPRPNG